MILGSPPRRQPFLAWLIPGGAGLSDSSISFALPILRIRYVVGNRPGLGPDTSQHGFSKQLDFSLSAGPKEHDWPRRSCSSFYNAGNYTPPPTLPLITGRVSRAMTNANPRSKNGWLHLKFRLGTADKIRERKEERMKMNGCWDSKGQ